jgi:hypothetical protein
MQRSVNLKIFFSLNSITQKTNKILGKIVAYEARADFISFVLWAMEFQKKITFEIYKQNLNCM